MSRFLASKAFLDGFGSIFSARRLAGGPRPAPRLAPTAAPTGSHQPVSPTAPSRRPGQSSPTQRRTDPSADGWRQDRL